MSRRHVNVAGEFCVDRDQVIAAVEFNAVSGIVDNRDVGVARNPGEFAYRAAHGGVAEVEFAVDHIEASFLEHRRDRGRIAGWVGQWNDVLVCGVGSISSKAGKPSRSPEVDDKL